MLTYKIKLYHKKNEKSISEHIHDHPSKTKISVVYISKT